MNNFTYINIAERCEKKMEKCYTIEPGEYVGEENYFRCNSKKSDFYNDLCPFQDDAEMQKCILFEGEMK